MFGNDRRAIKKNLVALKNDNAPFGDGVTPPQEVNPPAMAAEPKAFRQATWPNRIMRPGKLIAE